MAIDDKRREQNRRAQATLREKRREARKNHQTIENLTRGLCAALRLAVRNGRTEFAPILNEDDAKTIENLGNYFAGKRGAGVRKSPSGKGKKVTA